MCSRIAVFVAVIFTWASVASSSMATGRDRRRAASAAAPIASSLPQTVTRVIQAAVDCRRVPGLSVSVVHRGQELLSTGFGWADVDAKIPATGSTRFNIGSITKTFTAALLGTLLVEHGYEKVWDTLVVDIMGPEFRLTDCRHRWTTVRDILSHRVGLASYSLPLMLGQNTHRSNREFCSRFQFLNVTSSNSFRDHFRYSNLMYVLAGCLIEIIGNDSYETLLTGRILRPLGMNSTRLIQRDSFRQFNDLAQTYYINRSDDKLYPLSVETLRCVEALQAAGGIITTAADMTKWMRFLLSHGQGSDGTEQPMIASKILNQMFSGQIPVSRITTRTADCSDFPVFDSIDTYGIGFEQGYYQGFTKQSQNGRVHGFDARMTLLTGAKLGIFSVCNGPAYLSVEVHQLVHYVVADAVLKLASRWLNDSTFLNLTSSRSKNNSTLCAFPSSCRPETPKRLSRPDGTTSPEDAQAVAYNLNQDLESDETAKWEDGDRIGDPERFLRRHHRMYTGSYGHLLFGNFTVKFNESSGELRFSYGVLGRGLLAFDDGLSWAMSFEGPMSFIHVAAREKHDSAASAGYLVLFRSYDHHKKRFGTLVVKAFEPKDPPIFIRGLKWSDAGSPAPCAAAAALRSTVGLAWIASFLSLLQLTIILT